MKLVSGIAVPVRGINIHFRVVSVRVRTSLLVIDDDAVHIDGVTIRSDVLGSVKTQERYTSDRRHNEGRLTGRWCKKRERPVITDLKFVHRLDGVYGVQMRWCALCVD